MTTKNKLALGLAALLLAVTAQAQSTGASPVSGISLRDNPGTLGHRFADLNYSWVDFREDGTDADGYIAGIGASTPLTPSLDVGFGYSYYRENNHRNPFTGTPFDVRAHQLATSATLYGANRGFKPFVSGSLGYQWSRGDIQSLRVDDHEWIWGASVGAEIPLGTFALTPRISYSDTFRYGSGDGSWHYGAEAHHWFNERMGGYLDATFHEPNRVGANAWTYTAGLRFRF